MSKQQLIALCVCNFIIYVGVSGLIGLIPIYLLQLGADASVTGFFLAMVSLALALGTIIGGKLSDRLQRRRGLLALGGALSLPTVLLMTQTTTVVPLMLLMVFLWYLNGMTMTMVNILGGLFSEPGERGRVFGILSLASSFGLAVGALINGRIVDRWGFPVMFAVFASFYIIIPIACRFLRDKLVLPSLEKTPATGLREVLQNRTFLFLLSGSFLAQAANSIIFLSRPLLMNALEFDATAISTAPAVGGLITLPLPLLVGWLADRFGRKQIIIACFLATPLAILLLLGSFDLWHFALASGLGLILGFSSIVGSALVTDTFPRESLGTTLSLLNMTPWIGIVAGLSVGGVVMNAFEIMPTLLFALVLGLLAALLLLPIQAQRAQAEPAVPPTSALLP